MQNDRPAPPGLTVEGYRPGDIAQVIALHMAYYGPNWGFGLSFESWIAKDLGAFFAGFDARRDLFLAARGADGRVAGTIAIDGRDAAAKGARLRWFILDDAQRGRGVGRDLLDRAVAFCDGRGYRRMYLTTFAGLDAARRLYEARGFVLTKEAEDEWQGGVLEQWFERFSPNV